MFSANWIYNAWADHLREALKDGCFEGGLSFDKDTLYLRFESNSETHITLEIKFLDGHLMILTSNRIFDSNDYRKGIVQFKEIGNQPIFKIVNNPSDRWICIVFSNRMELWFKGFGKYGNVLLRKSQSSETLQIFRLSQKSDWEFQYPDIAENHGKFEPLQEVQPIELPAGVKVSPLLIDNQPFSIVTLVDVQLRYIRKYYFDQAKHTITSNLEKKAKHLKKILGEAKKRLADIETRRSNKELGDLILTNAHSIKPGLTKALVTDYYTDQRIWIKLNPELNAPENAKKYYGKAKNESIEISKLQDQVNTTEKSLSLIESSLESALAATEFKSLKPLQKSNIAKPEAKQPDTLPYKIVEFQGFTIWIGKNNKANDQMLKLCQKNDLWLHAKDVAGSHVILRKKGAEFPQAVIDFAAQQAAKNSKAKTQQVVPVIATLRKFVSKPKNAAFGEVNVLKEEIVDAFLK
ncbi:MAG: NFACT RNA binding domain-containing protein [Bacteroidetes bacterium]|nr:NFACT RNA binding domain-containing protein [Bacteroidota bacterium]